MDKGQWSSVAAMANYLHDDDDRQAGSTGTPHQTSQAGSQAGDP
jgi:hypothetical protein